MTGLDKFKRDMRNTAKINGIKIILSKKNTLIPPGCTLETKGYFDESNKELCVSIAGPEKEWLPTLIHESCHMDQYINDNFLWQKCTPALELFDKWLTNKAIVKREVLEEAVQDIIRLELDCERRVIKKINKYKLNVDITNYQKLSNLNLYSYLYSFEKKKWLPTYDNRKPVYNAVSSRLKKSYLKIPRRLYRVLEKEYKTFFPES